MEPHTKEEFDTVIGLLKRNKTNPGIDNITSEILKDRGETIREWLLCICQLIWDTEEPPDVWGKGIVLSLPKKGDLSYCNKNRGITLLDISG